MVILTLSPGAEQNYPTHRPNSSRSQKIGRNIGFITLKLERMRSESVYCALFTAGSGRTVMKDKDIRVRGPHSV